MAWGSKMHKKSKKSKRRANKKMSVMNKFKTGY